MTHEFNENPDFSMDMSFGEFVRKKRRLLGMNQSDFGQYLGGYHQHTISMWELGITSPPFEDAREIIKFLGAEIKFKFKEPSITCVWQPKSIAKGRRW